MVLRGVDENRSMDLGQNCEEEKERKEDRATERKRERGTKRFVFPCDENSAKHR